MQKKANAFIAVLCVGLICNCVDASDAGICAPGDSQCNLLALSSYTNCTYASPPVLLDLFRYNGASTQSLDLLSFDSTVLVLIGPTATSRWIVRASFDAGATWEITDDYVYPGGVGAQGKGLFRGPDGAVYATGFGVDSGGIKRWLVRRSADGGRTWTTVDEFGDGTADHEPAQGAGATLNGLRVVGMVTSPAAFVTRSSVDGFSWQTLGQELLANEPRPGEISQSPDGALFTPGARRPAASDIDTIVKSVDNGLSWSVKDQYLPAGHLNSQSTSILSESNQHFVTGFSNPTAGEFVGNLRRSLDGGETWQLLREFADQPVALVYGAYRAPNLTRDLFLPGTEGTQFGMSQHGVVYRSRDDGATWSKFIEQSVNGEPVTINGFMNPAPGGAIYILTIIADAGGSNAHAVQLLPCF